MNKKSVLVVAVSGGVDSMVMLDMLIKQADYSLVVAHVNHGIRPDSEKDEALVQQFAKSHGLPMEVCRLNLGKGASEQTARRGRHEFLNRVKTDYGAEAIATAHHLDDVVETIILNFMRGTGWRGLCSLRETDSLKRPLLHLRKSQVILHAIENGLRWHEDSTNDDLRYTRNLIRHFYLPKLQSGQFDSLVKLWRSQCLLRSQIDELVDSLVESNFDRHWLELDYALTVELLRAWLGSNYQAATFKRLVEFGREALPGKKFNLPGNEMILAERDKLVAIGRR